MFYNEKLVISILPVDSLKAKPGPGRRRSVIGQDTEHAEHRVDVKAADNTRRRHRCSGGSPDEPHCTTTSQSTQTQVDRAHRQR